MVDFRGFGRLSQTLPELQDDFVIAVGAHPASLSVLNRASPMMIEQWAEGDVLGGTQCLNHFQRACLSLGQKQYLWLTAVCCELVGFFLSPPSCPILWSLRSELLVLHCC